MSHKMSLIHFIFDFVNRAQDLYTIGSPSNTTNYKNISKISISKSRSTSGNVTFDSIIPASESTTSVLHASTLESNQYLFNYYIFLFTLWILSHVSANISKIRMPFYYIKVLSEHIILNSTVIICLPVILVFNTAISTTRYFIRVYFKFFEKGEILLMKSEDAFWAIEAFAQSCNFNSLYVLEGDCCMRTICQAFQNVVEKPDYERMRRVVIRKFGFYCWRRVRTIDIRQHVKLLSDPTSVMTETQVFDKIREFSDQVFLQDKPPWEVLVVPHFEYNNKNGYDNECIEVGEDGATKKNYFALVFRIHHAIMDGISAGQIIRNEIADDKCRLSVDPCAKINLSKFQKFCAYSLTLATGVRSMCQSLTLMESNCYHSGKQLKGPKWVGWSRKIDLNGLRDVKNKSGTTTTTILLSALGLGLKSVARKKNLNLSSVIHAAPTVAMLPYPNTKPQNRFTLAHLPIKIDCKTRIETVREVYKVSNNLASSSALMMNQAMLWLVGRWPVIVMEMFMHLIHATILVSNVPGFKEKTYLFGGHRLVDAVGWAPIKGSTGIGMCLFSYNGKVRACVVADQVVLPKEVEVQDLISEFESEIDKLACDAQVSSCFTNSG